MTDISEPTRRLFEEVKEEIIISLQCLLEDLWIGFSHLGDDDETKRKKIKQLIPIEREHYRDVISEIKTKVEDMQNQIEKLKEETEELSKFLSLDNTMIEYNKDMLLCDYKKELEERISEYREQILVTKLGVSAHELQEKFQQTNNRILELRERLAKLWDFLEEDQIHRENFLHAHQGCHPYAEAAIKEEIKRCDQIKKQKIQVLVANLRTKIKLMWDNVMYSVRERESFVLCFQDVFTEDTLTRHEMYLDNITRFYDQNRQIFDLVMTRKNLWMKMSELEARATDSTRFQNRGGQLLQEEKERKVINNKLPKIEEQLRELILQYENRTGLTFTVEGKPLLQLMDDDWEAKKAMRHNKMSARKQALSPQTSQKPLSPKTPLSPQTALLPPLGVSPLGKRNRTAAGLATHEGNKPPQKRQLITGSADKACATTNNKNQTALERSAVTSVKRRKRISGRLAAKAFEGRGETVHKKLDYSIGNNDTFKVTVNASILKKNKRNSGSRRRRSSVDPAHPSHAAPNPLMNSTFRSTYTFFQDCVNEYQNRRNSKGITIKVTPASAEVSPTIVHGKRH